MAFTFRRRIRERLGCVRRRDRTRAPFPPEHDIALGDVVLGDHHASRSTATASRRRLVREGAATVPAIGESPV